MNDASAGVRQLSVGIFLFASVMAFSIAAVSEAEESYITWSSSQPLGLAIFSGANLVAAGLALIPGSNTRARVGGALLLAPAILLMNASDSTQGTAKWLLVAGAAAIVVLGGSLASGIRDRIAGSRRP